MIFHVFNTPEGVGDADSCPIAEERLGLGTWVRGVYLGRLVGAQFRVGESLVSWRDEYHHHGRHRHVPIGDYLFLSLPLSIHDRRLPANANK